MNIAMKIKEIFTVGRIVSIDSDGNEHYPYADWNNDNLTIKKEIHTNDKKETNE